MSTRNDINRMRRLLYGGLVAALLSACGNEAPMDANTRAAIDSTATSQISLARIELDSACTAAEKTELPLLVDSIKKVRLREIEQQLKNIRK